MEIQEIVSNYIAELKNECGAYRSRAHDLYKENEALEEAMRNEREYLNSVIEDLRERLARANDERDLAQCELLFAREALLRKAGA